MISIIVPVYKVETYVQKCIESILNQTISDWELILVDDGSPDKSGEICDRYSVLDCRIKTYHLTNGGPSRARNWGLSVASGEWILFVDSDDWIDSDTLSYIEKYPDSDVIFFGFKKISNNKPDIFSIGYTTKVIVPDEIDEVLCRLFKDRNQYFGYTCNKLYKRSVIEEHNIRFEENISIKEDEVFSLEYCKEIKSLVILDTTPYNYRILDDSLSHTLNKYYDYYNLAQILNQEIEYTKHFDMLYCAFVQRIMYYYLNAIMEIIRYKKSSNILSNALCDSLMFYKRHPEISLPSWLRLPYKISYSIFSIKCIELIFRVRNIVVK